MIDKHAEKRRERADAKRQNVRTPGNLLLCRRNPGRPLIVGKALKANSLSAGFLTAYQQHFENEGAGIFAEMYKRYPQDYFWGLVKLVPSRSPAR